LGQLVKEPLIKSNHFRLVKKALNFVTKNRANTPVSTKMVSEGLFKYDNSWTKDLNLLNHLPILNTASDLYRVIELQH